MFDTTKEDLKDILRKVDDGKLQLPDFQRDYVWGDEDVRSLIASIAKGFPVGALLTLETGGTVSFKPRVLAGAPEKGVSPAELLLDGQQRITSLYQSMYSQKPVRTRTARGTEVERFYYIDMKKTPGGFANIEDAIVGVPANKIIKTNFGKTVALDLSSRAAEFAHDLFPLNQVFDSRDWQYGWRDFWKAENRDVGDLDRDFFRYVIDVIERYKMPIIRLDRDNSREAICLVFEKVNVGGKKLDAFELVTAIYAADNFDLRRDWNGPLDLKKPGRRDRMVGSGIVRRDVLTQVSSTDFLQACTLLHTREMRIAKEGLGLRDKELPRISCDRATLLSLPLVAYERHADNVERGFIDAGAFLNELKIIWNWDVPYPPLVVGLAAVFAASGHEAQTATAKEKLAQWFWSVTLGELYGSTTESRLARDVPELVEWIDGHDQRPRSLDEALFQRDRLFTLRSRLSAAYKGMHALLMQHGCLDFITGRGADLMTFLNDQIDIHHIFPQHWCKEHGITPGVFNCIVNKTPLFRRTNIEIGGDAPSIYLKRIETKYQISPTKLDQYLRTHLIEPKLLREDNFEGFFAARTAALASMVTEAMGKPIVEDHDQNEPEFEAEETVVAEEANSLNLVTV